jgi:hypothetical protein
LPGPARGGISWTLLNSPDSSIVVKTCAPRRPRSQAAASDGEPPRTSGCGRLKFSASRIPGGPDSGKKKLWTTGSPGRERASMNRAAPA